MGAQALLRRPGARVFLRASPAAPERPGIALLPPANTTDRPGWALVQELNGFSALGVEVGPAVWAHLQDDDWQPGLFPGPVLTGVVPRSSYDDFQVRGFQCYGTEEAEEMLAIFFLHCGLFFPGRKSESPTMTFRSASVRDGLPRRHFRATVSRSVNRVIYVSFLYRFTGSFQCDSFPGHFRGTVSRSVAAP